MPWNILPKFPVFKGTPPIHPPNPMIFKGTTIFGSFNFGTANRKIYIFLSWPKRRFYNGLNRWSYFFPFQRWSNIWYMVHDIWFMIFDIWNMIYIYIIYIYMLAFVFANIWTVFFKKKKSNRHFVDCITSSKLTWRSLENHLLNPDDVLRQYPAGWGAFGFLNAFPTNKTWGLGHVTIYTKLQMYSLDMLDLDVRIFDNVLFFWTCLNRFYLLK